MIKIKNIKHRREVVTAINIYDEANGIASSQRAKYDRPIWWFVLVCLKAKGQYEMTIDDIVKMLEKKNLFYSYQSVRRILHVMINKDESIHPHCRNCGISCYDAVTLLGDIHKSDYVQPQLNDIGRPREGYYLGYTEQTIKRRKQALKLTI